MRRAAWVTTSSWMALVLGLAPATRGAASAAGRAAAPRVLLVSAASDEAVEPELPLARQTLDAAGVAYDHFELTTAGEVNDDPLPLTDAAGAPLYTGIVLTTDRGYVSTERGWTLALDDQRLSQLRRYAAEHAARIVALHAQADTAAGGAGFLAPSGAPNGDAVPLVAHNDYIADLAIHAHWPSQGSLVGAWHFPVRPVRGAAVVPVIYADRDRKDIAAAILQLGFGVEQLSFYFSQGPGVAASNGLAKYWAHWLGQPPSVVASPIGRWRSNPGVDLEVTPDYASWGSERYFVTVVTAQGRRTGRGVRVPRSDELVLGCGPRDVPLTVGYFARKTDAAADAGALVATGADLSEFILDAGEEFGAARTYQTQAKLGTPIDAGTLTVAPPVRDVLGLDWDYGGIATGDYEGIGLLDLKRLGFVRARSEAGAAADLCLLTVALEHERLAGLWAPGRGASRARISFTRF
jgi:hypothetical protein